MPTRAQLEKMAARSDLIASKFEARAAVLREQAVGLRKLADLEDTGNTLPGSKQSGKVNVTDMDESHAMAISKARRRGKKQDAFQKACDKKNLTQNGLAERLGISVASLSRYRSDRPIPRNTADEIKTLIGYAGPWPRGIVE